MKKINTIALICTAAVALTVSSCSKEPLAQPKGVCSYDNTDVKSIIKAANPELYTRMYENKQEPGTITIIKGYHDAGGNCTDEIDEICSIIVVTTHPALTIQDSISLYDSNPNINLSFNAKGDAVLIEAKPDAPTSADVRTVDITVDANGNKTISYVPFP